MRRFCISVLLLLALAPTRAANRNTYTLPEDRGAAGTLAALEKLPVYVRVLHTTAHPDDESAATLTWLSRNIHARTALFSLTRGEGGQNILGSEQYDALSVVRTGELLEACKLYGVELYFSTACDFGFSKSADEALSKWGHEATLEEMVRFIRTWRPTILISRFQGTSSDGHGHHQAAGIITREAFRAAGDPQKFAGHLKLGIRPWQPRKLYVSEPGFGQSSAETVEAVRVPVGDYNPVLGRSYREIGAEGYSKHRSQGNGAVYAPPGRAFENYALADSVLGSKTRDRSFFDSIDTTLQSIIELAGSEKSAVPFLQNDLTACQRYGSEALTGFHAGNPAVSAGAAAKGAATLAESVRKVERSSLSEGTKRVLVDALHEKLEDFQNAVSATLGIYLEVRAQDVTVVPGEKEPITVSFYNQGPEEIDVKEVILTTPKGWISSLSANATAGKLAPGSTAVFSFSVDVPAGAAVTEPFWFRENKEAVRFRIRPTDDSFAPFGQPVVRAEATYRFGGAEIRIQEPARAQAGDPLRGSDFVELQVVPALSVTVLPDFAIAPLSPDPQTRQIQVSVLNNEKGGSQGVIRLRVPEGWRVEPAESKFAFARKGEAATAKFLVHVPGNVKAGNYPVEAVATARGKDYRRGYTVISYPENWTRNLHEPARSYVEAFDVKVAPNLKVGYVMGSGDGVAAAIERLGVSVQMLSGTDLAFGDLGRFSAIVTGVRAYNVNDDLRANNQRLLQYVQQGGTLIVQYNRPLGQGSEAPFPYGPYPMSNTDVDRITVEDSPIRILDPQNPIFNTPNKVTGSDFSGWIVERGTYFMHGWDSRYTALLSGNDPGEKPLNGGMLITRYGKGFYIYSAYAWFRQLPAGVPGAFRIFANMLSIGKH